MGREGSFLKGFYKQAGVFHTAKRLALATGLVGGASYVASKALQKAEDPEQARLRQLRKMKALPYQAGAQ